MAYLPAEVRDPTSDDFYIASSFFDESPIFEKWKGCFTVVMQSFLIVFPKDDLDNGRSSVVKYGIRIDVHLEGRDVTETFQLIFRMPKITFNS